jgi:FixJ family two-component response regulator
MKNAQIASKPDHPIVYIVDDDQSIRDALLELFLSLGTEAAAFDSSASFLSSFDLRRPGCVLLDIRMPGLSGLALQTHLDGLGSRMPIIIMTGYGDVSMSVKAMKAGAVDFLEKPFRDQDLIEAVAAALAKDAQARKGHSLAAAVATLARSLTPREREVMDCVVSGLMNKQIAHKLGISEITVKLHRGNAMRKMEANTVADLVRKAALIESPASS